MRPLRLTAAVFLAFLAGGAGASTITYTANIDTSTLAGTTGSVDFNFEPGPFGSRQATAQIVGFGGDGTTSGSAIITGEVSGSLPGNLRFDNGTAYNDYFQSIRYGSLLSFDFTLSGTVVGSPDTSSSGSTFAFSLFSDTAGTMPALTSDMADGYAFTVDINSDGSTILHNYTNGPVPLKSPASVTPELSTWVMVATGLIVGVWRLKAVKDSAGLAL